MWQDTILSIINFGFILTLLPAIFRNHQLHDVEGQSLATYFSTSVLLTIMSYVLFTLELKLSALSTAGTAITWYILLYQKMRYSSKES
jgi:uncharacterized paraquat-inducible protein A